MYAYKKVKYFYYQTKLIHYLCIKFNLVINMEAYKQAQVGSCQEKENGQMVIAAQQKSKLQQYI